MTRSEDVLQPCASCQQPRYRHARRTARCPVFEEGQHVAWHRTSRWTTATCGYCSHRTDDGNCECPPLDAETARMVADV